MDENLKILFETGIGRLKTTDDRALVVEVSEPIVIAAFKGTSINRSLINIIRRQLRKLFSNPQGLGYEFESLVAYSLLKYFKTPTAIEELPLIPTEFARKYEGKLARIRIPVPHSPHFIQPLHSTGTWISKFLEEGIAPFGFPDTNTGPEIIFCLEILNSDQSVNCNLLVLVQVLYFI